MPVNSNNLLAISFVLNPDPPKLNPNYPKDHTTNEGEAVSLGCVVESSHPDPNITWVKLNESEEAFPWGSILNLTNVTQDDEGKYYCLADNGVVGQVKSRSAELEVKGKFCSLYCNDKLFLPTPPH